MSRNRFGLPLLALLATAAVLAIAACGGEKIVVQTVVVEKEKIVEKPVEKVVVATPTAVPETATAAPEITIKEPPSPKSDPDTLNIGLVVLDAGPGWPASTMPAYLARNIGIGEELFTQSVGDNSTGELATSWELAPDLSKVTIQIP